MTGEGTQAGSGGFELVGLGLGGARATPQEAGRLGVSREPSAEVPCREGARRAEDTASGHTRLLLVETGLCGTGQGPSWASLTAPTKG